MISAELIAIVLKGNLLFAVLILAYQFTLSKTAFFNLNRIYLLLAPVLAFLLPWLFTLQESEPLFSISLPLLDIGSESAALGVVPILTWSDALVLIYLLGLLGMCARTALRFIQIHGGLKGQDPSLSFTFMRKVVLGSSLKAEMRKSVFAHEQVHAEQLHSLDLMWYELLHNVFWLNPAFVLGKSKLKEVHEYIADDIASTRVPDYPRSLVAFALGVNTLPMVNEFSRNDLKNRMNMMNKKQNKKDLMRYLSVLALVAVTVFSLACVETDTIEPNKEKVYSKVDTMPMFPGCDANTVQKDELKKCAMGKLIDFMVANVQYPKTAKDNGIEGKVMVKFLVESNGKIVDAHVVKGVEATLDAEALRVVSAMPNWVPGMHEGKKVQVEMVLPIMFSMKQ